MQNVRTIGSILFLVTLLATAHGCDNSAKSGSLLGAGIGALAGQAIGGNTEGTLIGAAVGTGIGYVIGNEKDKKHAAEMSQQNSGQYYSHTEVSALGGTRWALISLSPRDVAEPYASKVLAFGKNGRVVTTTTRPGGTVDTFDESYRVVGDTLIVNKPGYIINARFTLADDQLIISADKFSAVLRRLR